MRSWLLPDHFVQLWLLYLLNMVYNIKCNEDDCRNVIYKPQISDKALTGHVIANESVRTMDQCHILCFLEPNCVSTNYNTKPGVIPNCELNSAEDEQYPKNLTDKPGVIYQAMVNNCVNKKCPSKNMTCQSGYGFHGYRCVCPECSYGDRCQNYTHNTVLYFQHKSIENKVVLEHPFDTPLTAFTISMWVQIDNSTAMHTPFSYATRDNRDEIHVVINNQTVHFNLKYKDRIIKNGSIFDRQWHHICLTWENSRNAVFYIDGKVFYIDGKVSYNSNHGQSKIKKGVLVLGQEQDAYSGDFDKKQSFQGNLTSFNMWNKVLPVNEISALAKKRPSGEGNIVKWTELIRHRSPSLKYFCT